MLDVEVTPFANRLEVVIALPAGVDSVTGGGQVLEEDDGHKAMFTFAPTPPAETDPDTGEDVLDSDGNHVPDRTLEEWATCCAQEAARLVIASSPGDTPDPQPEQPSAKSRTLTIDPADL